MARKKKENRHITLWVLAAIIFLIGASLFIGYWITKAKHPSYEYNGYYFVKQESLWYMKAQIGRNPQNISTIYTIPFRNDPKSVENIFVSRDAINKILSSEKIFFTADPDSNAKIAISIMEVGRLIGNKYDIFNIPTQTGVIKEIKGQDVPVITCINATGKTRVMYFLTGNETEVNTEGECILIKGSDEEQVIKAADALSYKLLGIIK